MADYIRPGTCGACKEFEFEGNNKKGYCRRYGAYYWDDDSCRHYDEDDRRLSSGGGSTCFLTTACCQYKNLPDDCYELTTLRMFRDTYLINTPDGKALIEEYYKIAPSLVNKIMENEEKETILEGIYAEVCKIISLIETQMYDQAIIAYKEMVFKVQHAVA